MHILFLFVYRLMSNHASLNSGEYFSLMASRKSSASFRVSKLPAITRNIIWLLRAVKAPYPSCVSRSFREDALVLTEKLPTTTLYSFSLLTSSSTIEIRSLLTRSWAGACVVTTSFSTGTSSTAFFFLSFHIRWLCTRFLLICTRLLLSARQRR